MEKQLSVPLVHNLSKSYPDDLMGSHAGFRSYWIKHEDHCVNHGHY